MFVREGVSIGDREISIETGKMAKQAGGAVIVRQNDSMVMVCATGSKAPRHEPKRGKAPFRSPTSRDVTVCK